MAPAAAIQAGAGVVSSGAGLIGGIARGRKQRAAQTAEIVGQIEQARADIATTGEQLGLSRAQAGEAIGAFGRETSEILGGQAAGFTGAGVFAGRGSAAQLRAGTEGLRSREEGLLKKQFAVERRGLERQREQLVKQEARLESALRGVAGRRRGRKRRQSKQLEELGFQFTP